jgi:hypothetical protein
VLSRECAAISGHRLRRNATYATPMTSG